MRLAVIDTLRGLAIFAMILIHSTAYFLSDKAVFFVWNYSQFAVPIFFFCSAYLFFLRKNFPHIKHAFPYFKKRLLRLLVPFYIFLAGYFLLIKIFEPSHLTQSFMIRMVTLTTKTNDISWLVLVFLMFAFINPLLAFFFTHKRVLFYGYFICSFIAALYLMFFPTPVNFKFIMWLSWSLTSFFAFYFIEYERRKWFYVSTLLFTFLFFMAALLLQLMIGHSPSFYDNKYPPNLYYVSYGLFSITALYYVVQKEILKNHPLEKFLHYLSINSYALFFIHFLVIYFLTQTIEYRGLGWAGFFLVVLGVSIVVQKVGSSLFNGVAGFKLLKQSGV